MRLVSLHSKGKIEALLRRNTYLHLYSIGDLDDFFWEYTTWYGLQQGGPPVLLYTGAAPPVLLALAEEPLVPSRELLRLVMPLLPRRLYAHLSEGLADVLGEAYRVSSHGKHYKMGLTKTALVQTLLIEQQEPKWSPDYTSRREHGSPDLWHHCSRVADA